jgi:hypothetical protein
MGRTLAALVALASLGAPAAEPPPAPPYYSVQLMSLSHEAAALDALRTVADQPYARIELREGFHLVRVGVHPEPAPARAERDAFRARGLNSARVVKVTRAVSWLMSDGSRLDPGGTVTAGAPGAASGEPAATVVAAGEPAGPAPDAAPRAAPEPEPPPIDLENAGGATNWGSTVVTLERLGFRDGFPIEGSEGTRRLFLPLPAGVNVRRAWLSFDVDFSELLIDPSALQFRVNDTSRRAIRRGPVGTRQRVEIPLNARDLDLDFVEVEVDYSLFLHHDVCLSRKLVGAYALVTPDSGLKVQSADGLPPSVRAAWSLLPPDVTVAARLNELTPAEFQALLHLATLLQRYGHRTVLENLTDAPTTAHIVVAPTERYVRGATGSLDATANLRLVRSRGPLRRDGTREERAFILVDATRPLPAAGMLALPWRQAGAAALIDVATAAPWPEARDASEVVRLRDLGFDDAERVFNFSAQWHIALPFGPLGDARRPSRVILDVYGPRVSEVRGPTFVSAYYNDRLVYSAALRQEGVKETLDFELPLVQMRARNNLKIVAQRDEAADDCKLNQAAYPLSVSPWSVVEAKALNQSPQTFAELVPHQRALEVYLAKDALAAAARVIPMLVGLGEHFWPDVPPPEVRLFEPGAEIRPTGEFLVVGDASWAPDAWVRFDQGRVRLRSNATGAERMLLDFTADAPVTVLQMVRAGGYGGAWLKATGGYASVPAKRTLFEDQNVAFLGPRGVLAALKVGSTRDYRVEYPDAKGWFAATGAWRTALFVIAWVLVLGLLIYLYRRTRRHHEG